MRLFAVIAFFLICSPVFAAGWPGANAQIDQTNFLVNNNCSATLIDAKRGYLITANHCITAQFKIVQKQDIEPDGTVHTRQVRVAVPGTVSQLYFKGASEVQRNSYAFRVVRNDEDMDLALIQVQTKLSNTIAAAIACKGPQRLDTVYAVGNSLGVLYASATEGIVASLSRNYIMLGIDDHGEHRLLQSTAPIGGGNSGGALYNDKGELVGVNVRGYQAVAPLALSVPLSDIKVFLKREGLDSLWSRCEAK